MEPRAGFGGAKRGGSQGVNGSKKTAWILVSPPSTTPASGGGGGGGGGFKPKGFLSVHKEAPQPVPPPASPPRKVPVAACTNRGSWGWALPQQSWLRSLGVGLGFCPRGKKENPVGSIQTDSTGLVCSRYRQHLPKGEPCAGPPGRASMRPRPWAVALSTDQAQLHTTHSGPISSLPEISKGIQISGCPSPDYPTLTLGSLPRRRHSSSGITWR